MSTGADEPSTSGAGEVSRDALKKREKEVKAKDAAKRAAKQQQAFLGGA